MRYQVETSGAHAYPAAGVVTEESSRKMKMYGWAESVNGEPDTVISLVTAVAPEATPASAAYPHNGWRLNGPAEKTAVVPVYSTFIPTVHSPVWLPKLSAAGTGTYAGMAGGVQEAGTLTVRPEQSLRYERVAVPEPLRTFWFAPSKAPIPNVIS